MESYFNNNILEDHMELFHNPRTSKFIGDFDGKRVEVAYREISRDSYELTGTFVPEDMRGQGFGKTLVKNVLGYAEKQRLKLKITCPFIKQLIRKSKSNLTTI